MVKDLLLHVNLTQLPQLALHQALLVIPRYPTDITPHHFSFDWRSKVSQLNLPHEILAFHSQQEATPCDQNSADPHLLRHPITRKGKAFFFHRTHILVAAVEASEVVGNGAVMLRQIWLSAANEDANSSPFPSSCFNCEQKTENSDWRRLPTAVTEFWRFPSLCAAIDGQRIKSGSPNFLIRDQRARSNCRRAIRDDLRVLWLWNAREKQLFAKSARKVWSGNKEQSVLENDGTVASDLQQNTGFLQLLEILENGGYVLLY